MNLEAVEMKAWSVKRAEKEALKFNTKNAFKTESSGAYSYAQRVGILEQICAHMTPSSRKQWTDEDLLVEAKKYDNLKDFRNNSGKAYITASKRKILHCICSHMHGIEKSQKKDLIVKTLTNEDRGLYNELKLELEKMGLKPLEIKIRTCVICKSLFESIGDRTCGCTRNSSSARLSGLDVL